MNIGPYHFQQPIALAPMAGISDRPFRNLCRRLGADYAVSEMLATRTALWDTQKSRTRLNFDNESAPRIFQIAGADPDTLADCARMARERGADIIDINMGCPAKKVCNKQAGSALLENETLVARILASVVAAVEVPVTLKTRTGTSPQARNGVGIARLAEDCGIAAITMHGRTRACAFRGKAEYDTIAAVKQAVSIPVIANGDIISAEQAVHVLADTGVDGLMIGRGAQGNPWLFGAIKAALAGRDWNPPDLATRALVMREHLDGLHALYGELAGVRIARKHIGWYLAHVPGGAARRALFNRLDSVASQRQFIDSLADEATLELAA